ncbi:MAG: TIGR02757 family protein [Bacteroidales bacterium]|nr:TIGR02757 family protein [Bacteroidales bacterium]
MDQSVKETLIGWAQEYNDPKYFTEDPIIFPKHFAGKYDTGEASLQDIEIAALLASHLAWGRRAMIVRDCGRMLDEMCWRPYDYVMNGEYRNENASLHRTIKWSEFAVICERLKSIYSQRGSLEGLTDMEIRCTIFGQKEDRKAPNKKISMMRRWMVRDDGKVDLGVWKSSDKKDLILPLDVHVYTQASALGLTSRKQKDIVTAREITEAFKEIWPDDPCLGDYALFGYGVSHQTKNH